MRAKPDQETTEGELEKDRQGRDLPMSTLSIPEEVKSEVKQQSAMTGEKTLIGAVNLMAYPMSSAAALSAFQFGIMSHAFGFWMEAVADAAEASQRMWRLGVSWEAENGDDPSISEPRSMTSQADSAARTLMADFESASRDVLHATAQVADAVAHDVEEASQALMPEEFRKPPAVERPKQPDDLKLISGIGPKLERTLNELGVWTFAQIAQWTEQEIAWVDDFLGFRGRVGRDNWLAQAEALAGGENKDAPEQAAV